MRMQIISWNVRGLHDPDKGRVIKSCLLAKNPSFVCLRETKTSSMTLRMIRSLGIGWTLGWSSLDARGTAEGIFLLWDLRVLKCLDMEVGAYCIYC